jgi:hypothetical protein
MMVTFQRPPSYQYCCGECAAKNRQIAKGQSFPVVKIEETNPLHCVGGKRYHIRTDCGKVFCYSVEYFFPKHIK